MYKLPHPTRVTPSGEIQSLSSIPLSYIPDIRQKTGFVASSTVYVSPDLADIPPFRGLGDVLYITLTAYYSATKPLEYIQGSRPS